MTVYPKETSDLNEAKSRIKNLLNEGWIQGSLGVFEGNIPTTDLDELINDPNITKVCLMGAVYRSNLHIDFRTNFIVDLNKKIDKRVDNKNNVSIGYFNDQVAKDVNDVIRLVDEI